MLGRSSNFPMMIVAYRPNRETVKLSDNTSLYCPRCTSEIPSITGYYSRTNNYVCTNPKCKTELRLLIWTDIEGGHTHYAFLATVN
jgi:transposase-like protein